LNVLLHALVHLARLRWLGAAFCVLAMLCVTTQASAFAGATAHARVDAETSIGVDAKVATTPSASEVAQPKDRVGGFDQNSPPCVKTFAPVTLEQLSGFRTAEAEHASASTNAAEGGLTTVYRVEGTVNQRLAIDATGNVSIQGQNMLFLNFGDAARAEQFLATRVTQGMEGATMKSFQVQTSFFNELKASGVPESMARQFPDSPIVVDATKAANQFGLRPPQIEALKSVIVPGSGR
jgi:hypothetical protein